MAPEIFPYRDLKPHARVRLFCLPYAGGSASLYRLWGSALGPSVEVVPVELPGRGRRMGEALVTDFASLVDGLATAMRPLLDKPYALFGHSLGSTVAFELARALRDYRPAELLFVSAGIAPHLPDPNIPDDLSDDGLVAELRRRGATPPELFDEPELLEIFLPIIRADFELIEAYQLAPGAPLAFPVTAIAGTRDPEVDAEGVAAWKEHTSAAFRVVTIEGDHFFITAQQRALLAAIAKQL